VNAPHSAFPKRIHSAITTSRVDAAHQRLLDEFDPAGFPIRKFLQSRGTSQTTIMAFSLMAGVVTETQSPLLGVPWFEDARCTMVRQFTIPEGDWRTHRQISKGNSRYRGLFNVGAVRGQKTVVICGDEFDCMALWQSIWRSDYQHPPVAAAIDAHLSIPNEWVESLTSAERIVIWQDDSPSGIQATANLAQRLGAHRCYAASIPQETLDNCMDAHDELPINAQDLVRLPLGRESILPILRNATPLGESASVRPSHFKVEIIERIYGGDAARGIPFPEEGLKETLGFARPGDVYWWTGQTKHGKTSDLTELGEAFARTGFPTAMGFFEGSGPQQVTDNMHQRLLGKPIYTLKTQGEKDAAALMLEQLDDVPIHIIPLRGMHKWQVMEDLFVTAVQKHGCKVVILDHFNQIAADDQHMARDIVAHTDKTIHAIESMAVGLRVPVLLGGHPAKMDADVVPTARSGKGGSAIMQVVAGSVSVWRPEGIPGKWWDRKITVTPDGWGPMSVQMDWNHVLHICTLKRAADANTGHWLRAFDRGSLRTTYAGKKSLGKPGPQSDSPNTQPWTASVVPTHAQESHTDD
jgi:hypothetical protein